MKKPPKAVWLVQYAKGNIFGCWCETKAEAVRLCGKGERVIKYVLATPPSSKDKT